MSKQSRIQAIFDALDRTGPGTRSARNNMQGVERSVQKLTGLLGGLATAFLGAFSVRAVIENTVRQERAMKQLETVVRSTGGAAGFTAAEMAKMAADLQAVTTFGDEAVMEMQAVLATFTRLGRETFPEATEAVLNMSAALGKDLQSSAMQIGKALNDPVRGLSALAESGIQFTNQQRDMVKAMVEAGDTVGAQRVILAELETQFGGSARAARDTLGGALDGLKNAFGDLLEAKGGLPEAQERIEAFTSMLSDPNVQRGADQLMTALIEGLSKIVELATKLPGAFADMRAAGELMGFAPRQGTPEEWQREWDVLTGKRSPDDQAGIRFPMPERPARDQRTKDQTAPPKDAFANGKRTAPDTAAQKAFEERIKRANEAAKLYRTDPTDVAPVSPADAAFARLQGMAQAIERERQAREGSIRARLSEIELAERMGAIDEASAVKARIILQQELLGLQSAHQAQIDKLSDPSGWYAQQNAIDATRSELSDLTARMLEFSGTLSQGARQGLENYLKETESAFEASRRMAEQTAQAMEGAFSDFFFDAFRGQMKSLGDYVDAFLQAVQRSVAQSLAGRLTGSLLGAVGGMFGNGASRIINTSVYAGPNPAFHEGGVFRARLPGGEGLARLMDGERVLTAEQDAMMRRLDARGGAGAMSIQVVNPPGEPLTARASTQSNGQGGTDVVIMLEKALTSRMGRGSDMTRALEAIYPQLRRV